MGIRVRLAPRDRLVMSAWLQLEQLAATARAQHRQAYTVARMVLDAGMLSASLPRKARHWQYAWEAVVQLSMKRGGLQKLRNQIAWASSAAVSGVSDLQAVYRGARSFRLSPIGPLEALF